ncbi:MAG: cysteine hydrolase [Acidimicrobiaceae bacterium]|nr:cysteine hydrolase [Acidimicrobiaceae bacterium]MYE09048.1 cysteine hydrolase [Acidimicrobiaceae bacterium]MYI35839.1 cysteine hydrolase [Acidimicrobiaceae bacterium]
MTTASRRELEGLAALVDPASTAVLTMELQRGVVGPDAMMKALVERVSAAGTVRAAAAVCDAARAVGARVVHCVVHTRSDGAGTAVNCRILGLADRLRREQGIAPTLAGSDGARLVPQLGEDPRDLLAVRGHGLTPFTATSLDQTLRNLGVTTVVATGVSVNVGITGLCLSAVDLGYQVVLVRDAVAGVPAEYEEAVIEHSLAMVATVVTSAELLEAWA